ncbi:hypothetical protein SKUN_00966 [Spiroplasma kunkelii CR2-3x]|uniref:Uncharacterized protein n=1 Tax=Spiroplasma kunkelii CR2-3x TaxID=273035 RepID=A0A0K2JHF2_SPIKU|nr:hypothetical protein [Spiroplasma kunkelii]ALA97853.1 hypothetical protein SKUN_00966 [Spiroplasma kunkelii CR2-3x]
MEFKKSYIRAKIIFILNDEGENVAEGNLMVQNQVTEETIWGQYKFFLNHYHDDMIITVVIKTNKIKDVGHLATKDQNFFLLILQRKKEQLKQLLKIWKNIIIYNNE